MSKFDALALAVDTPSRMTLMRPGTREPLVDAAGEPAWIDLLSDDSQAARAFDDRQNDRRLSAMQNGTVRLSSSELRGQQVERLSILTAGWRLLGLDGSELALPFTAAAAAELYADHRAAWIVDQALAHVARRANFMPAKSTA